MQCRLPVLLFFIPKKNEKEKREGISMKTRKTYSKIAAFAAALTITAGMALPVQRCIFPPPPMTAYADEAYTYGESGIFSYRKYSDHIEISNCDKSATSVDIPSQIDGLPVTSIGMYAFQISSIKSVTIPDTVKELGHWSFSSCQNLTSVTIPDSVESIGIRAFEMCPLLSEINFPDHLVEISSFAFDNTPWMDAQRKKDPFVIVNGALIDAQDCKGIVQIPSDVKYVSASAFAKNTDVTSVVFPSSVKKVNDDTFFYCTNLTSVELKGVESIGIMAFDGCSKLSDVKISGKLKKIEDYAFSDISGTGTITFYGSKEMWDQVEKPKDIPFLTNSRYVFDTEHTEPADDIEGDVNMDGEFSISDLILLQKWLLNEPDITLKNPKAADFCNDGVLNAFDMCAMRKALVNK